MVLFESSDIQGSIRPTEVYGMANLITLRGVLRMVGKPSFLSSLFVTRFALIEREATGYGRCEERSSEWQTPKQESERSASPMF